jgi:hypothetical protein
VKLTLSVAVKLATAAGVNTTLIGQLPPGGIDVQEPVSEKSVGLVPWTDIAETCTAFSPTFERVTTCAGLDVPDVCVPKATVAGDKLTMVQVPVREIACGLPDALSATMIDPVIVPFAAGLKETEIVQLAPEARVD